VPQRTDRPVLTRLGALGQFRQMLQRVVQVHRVDAMARGRSSTSIRFDIS